MEDFLRGHSLNRGSINSMESSILSDDTDDMSTDGESLIQLEDNGNSKKTKHVGLFKETV